jgi:hypothetical protein
MEVVFCAEAEAELAELPEHEQFAMLAAVEKLRVVGDRLPYPHSSAVRSGHRGLRELRPRGGRSPWRAFYRRVGDRIVIAAIGPEAKHDQRGFDRAVRLAAERIARVEQGGTL